MGFFASSLICMRICKTVLDLHKSSSIISLYFKREIQWEIVCFENISKMVRGTSNKIKSKGETEEEPRAVLCNFHFRNKQCNLAALHRRAENHIYFGVELNCFCISRMQESCGRMGHCSPWAHIWVCLTGFLTFSELGVPVK